MHYIVAEPTIDESFDWVIVIIEIKVCIHKGNVHLDITDSLIVIGRASS